MQGAAGSIVAMSPAGTRRSRTEPATREPLSRERVVAAALVLVDRDGLDGLSMRRLAAEVGVEAMSLYHHVRDKADVLDALVGAVLDEIELPDSGDGRARALQICRELRRVVRAHPHVHTLVVERAFRSPSVLAPAASLLDALADCGLDDDERISAFWTLLSYVSGSLSCELADLPEGSLDGSGLPEGLFGRDLDEQFEGGLRTILAALDPA
jgi:AcrR family transcriptional regulator